MVQFTQAWRSIKAGPRVQVAMATALVAAWYGVAYWIARPLAPAPVVDSWLYAHSVSDLLHAGRLTISGYAQTRPAGQIVYGAAWVALFGAGFPSLDLSVALLGALGGISFYLLARSCQARPGVALLTTGLILANPCYLFLSFSFMTDVPFIALMLAALWLFSLAKGNAYPRILWLAALFAVVAFTVRPFAAATIVAFFLILSGAPADRGANRDRFDLTVLLPLALALTLCALFWIWSSRMAPYPWMSDRTRQRAAMIFQVDPVIYLRSGLLAPTLYLGLVTCPLAIPHLWGSDWRRGSALAAGLLVAAILCIRFYPGLPALPELSCLGSWDNALVLRGLPLRFSWTNSLAHWTALVLSCLGAAGLIVAALKLRGVKLGVGAVLFTAAIYWSATMPLWFFNDRYYLVMLPAACLILAVAPLATRLSWVVGFPLFGLLAYVSMMGLYAQQAGLRAVVEARDKLLASGVARSAIDAGYPLNGEDLFGLPGQMESAAGPPAVPMVTSERLSQYTIAAGPVKNTEMIGTTSWPGMLGFGRRELSIVRRINDTEHRQVSMAEIFASHESVKLELGAAGAGKRCLSRRRRYGGALAACAIFAMPVFLALALYRRAQSFN